MIRLHFRVSCNREATKVTLGSHHHPPHVHLIDHNQYYQYNVGEATLRNKSTKGGRGPKFATPCSPKKWFTADRLFFKPNNKCFCSKSLCLSQPFLVLVGPLVQKRQFYPFLVTFLQGSFKRTVCKVRRHPPILRHILNYCFYAICWREFSVCAVFWLVPIMPPNLHLFFRRRSGPTLFWTDSTKQY